MAKQKQVWERRIDLGESMAAFNLFLAYAELGAIRSTSLLCEELAKTDRPRSLGLLRNLQGRFKWITRAKAYDEHLIKVQFKAIEQHTKDDAIIFAQYVREYRHTSYQIADELLDKARQMLASPLYETTVDKLEQIEVNGETVEVATYVTMKPVRWNFNQAAVMVELSDKIRRLSLEVPTERKLYNFDFSENEAEKRLLTAQGIFQKLIADNLSQALLLDPTLTIEKVIETWREQVSTDWKIPADMLIYEQPVDGLTLEEFEM